MLNTLESKLQKKIIDILEKNNCYVVKTIVCNRSGIPDLLCCVNGKFVAIEVKTKTSESKLQEYNRQKIWNAKGYSFVFNEENYKTELQKIITHL